MTPRAPMEIVGPDQFRRARTAFEAALEQPPSERAAFLEDACRGDAPLRSAVEAMLRADSAPHALLDGGGAFGTVDRWRPGDAVAHFQIVALLGRGGMGEVYRARDETLGREVALKVLPKAALPSPDLVDRLARVQREAEVLAALNHPNIAAIFGVADAGDTKALVLELVDGPTLADRLAVGPLPLHEATGIARQVAAGLEAAHEHGIVHRDLKPSNIALRPDGTVKLLDFGLAKVAQPDAALGSALGAPSPTITSAALRQTGIVLGSAAYMSPEQARGQQADRRSDVWAFGAVLYEMLSGARAFDGENVSATLDAVRHGDVDGSRLPPLTPPALRHLLSRCLERNVNRRLRDVGEARVALEDLSIASAPVPALLGAPVPRRGWGRVAVVPAVAAVMGAAAAAVVLWPARGPGGQPTTRFVLSMPAAQTLLLDPQSRDLAITPDGTRVIYKGGARVDRTQLYAYPLDQLEPRPLIEPGLPKGPFASFDGRWIGFFEPGSGGAAMKKVAASGGPPIDVSRLDGPSRGATWAEDGTIIAASGAPSTGLLRIPASGGPFTVLTRPDRDRGEADHLWPQLMPDGKAVLFTITALNRDVDASQIALLDLASGRSTTLIRGGSQAHYVAGGWLAYVSKGALWAIAFDPKRRETLGTPTVAVPRLVTLPTGTAEFDVSRDGTLVYVSSGGTSDAPRTVVWVDRQGREEPVPAPARPYTEMRLSPDGTKVALEIADAGHDISVWDFARETLTRVTTDPGIDRSPVWTPDGRRLVFASQAGGVLSRLRWQAADGSGVAEPLGDGQRSQQASSVLPDASAVLFSEDAGVLAMSLDGTRRVSPLLQSSAGRANGAVVSPDGRWLAYTGRDEPGMPAEVFVSPLASPALGRTLVSTAGGSQPRWARDGRELFYTAVDGALMRVPIHPGTTFSAGTPTPLFARRYYNGLGLLERPGTYDVAPDGRRFLVLKQGDGPDQPATPATVVVVKNWADELRRLVSPSR
jgi:tRNA A-37 threonylcarbamoyl transferase component Bud32